METGAGPLMPGAMETGARLLMARAVETSARMLMARASRVFLARRARGASLARRAETGATGQLCQSEMGNYLLSCTDRIKCPLLTVMRQTSVYPCFIDTKTSKWGPCSLVFVQVHKLVQAVQERGRGRRRELGHVVFFAEIAAQPGVALVV